VGEDSVLSPIFIGACASAAKPAKKNISRKQRKINHRQPGGVQIQRSTKQKDQARLRGTMALTLEDLEAMMAGFAKAGFRCNQRPASPRNPIAVEWHTGYETRRYRLWAFDVTHGGGGPTVRAADEFRIQITNGPSSLADIDKDGAVDLLVGYSRDRDAIIAYDRRWLDRWIDKTAGGDRASPSVRFFLSS
jgi:hypothetical protein